MGNDTSNNSRMCVGPMGGNSADAHLQPGDEGYLRLHPEQRFRPPVGGAGVRISKVVYLGTGSAVPSVGFRNTSAAVVVLSTGKQVLIDCGEATQHQMMRSSSVKMAKIDLILITHLHGDHCNGLFGLLMSMAMQGREEAVLLVGPKGLKAMVEQTLALQGCGEPYERHYIELEGDGSVDLGPLTDFLRVSAHPLKHRVPTFGYVLEEPDKPGTLDAGKAKSLGAKGAQLGQLKRGEDVVLEDGTVVSAAACVGPSTPGAKIVFLQDTCDSSSAKSYAEGCDLISYEATYHDAFREKAIDHGHSTAAMAGDYAAEVGAKMLVLTHFSPRYVTQAMAARGSGGDNSEEVTVEQLVAEADAATPASCPVVAACDFMVIVKHKKKGFVVQAERDIDPDTPFYRPGALI